MERPIITAETRDSTALDQPMANVKALAGIVVFFARAATGQSSFLCSLLIAGLLFVGLHVSGTSGEQPTGPVQGCKLWVWVWVCPRPQCGCRALG